MSSHQKNTKDSYVHTFFVSEEKRIFEHHLNNMNTFAPTKQYFEHNNINQKTFIFQTEYLPRIANLNQIRESIIAKNGSNLHAREKSEPNNAIKNWGNTIPLIKEPRIHIIP